MKVTFRIPTEQFSYIEVEEDMPIIHPKLVMDKFHTLVSEYKESIKPKVGLGDKEMNAFIDRQLMGETNHIEEYNSMSDVKMFSQKDVVQHIKRALKRIEAKQNK